MDSFSYITCRISGIKKKKIEKGWLAKFGWTKEQYIETFPYAPLICEETRLKYAERTENRIKSRSESATKSNKDKNSLFHKNRMIGCKNFLSSDRSLAYRKAMSDKAKKQHENGLTEHIYKLYWSHSCKKKTYKELPYQSRLELFFLKYIDSLNLLHKISKAPILRKEDGKRYFPDYLFDNKYIIEIKSQYIEDKQGLDNINNKKIAVINANYKWLYIKDNNFTELELILKGYQQ